MVTVNIVMGTPATIGTLMMADYHTLRLQRVIPHSGIITTGIHESAHLKLE